MPKKPVLNVLWPQRFRKQRILLQVDHPQAEIIASSPVGLYGAKFLRTERRGRNRRSSGTIWTETLDFGWNVGLKNAHWINSKRTSHQYIVISTPFGGAA